MFRINIKEFVTSLPKQPKCKKEQVSLSILRKKNRLLLSKFFPPFLSVKLLSVLPERTVASFQAHVACHFGKSEEELP